MQGAGLKAGRRAGKAPSERPAFQPYRGKLAVRNERGDRGNVGIIRSPVRASILPDRRQTRTSKTCVWRWQERFMREGVDGLLREKTRPGRLARLSDEVAANIVAATLKPPPSETTHWTALAMAKVIGVSVSSVQRVWRQHGLQPHRMRQFKLSNDKQFAEKLRDVVGLYIDPPDHAVVLSFGPSKFWQSPP